MSDVKELCRKVSAEDVGMVLEDLEELFDNEVFEKYFYLDQLRKFEGIGFETIKWLAMQEEEHVHILYLLLCKVGLRPLDKKPELPQLESNSNKMIEVDIIKETETTMKYSKTISKTAGVLREVLEHIRGEELHHIEKLKEFLTDQRANKF